MCLLIADFTTTVNLSLINLLLNNMPSLYPKSSSKVNASNDEHLQGHIRKERERLNSLHKSNDFLQVLLMYKSS